MPDLPAFAFSFTAVVFAVLGTILVGVGIKALLRRRPVRFAVRTLAGLLLVSLGALAGALALGIQGYRALTREHVAARLEVRPIGPQRFSATFRFPDGGTATYELAGDEIYVDAHILKWHPYANMLGLHTAYELDRVAGRYRDIKDERDARRTVHALAREKPIDLYGLRRSYSFLSPLLDAEYGSASYVPITKPAEFEVRVSTTGLLIRPTRPHKP
jgi:hypothetical protein